MTLVERILQKCRIAKAAPHIPNNARVLDIGCFNGELFRRLGGRLRGGVGIDPLLEEFPDEGAGQNVVMVKGKFPQDIPPGTETFDVIAILAVFEHVAAENTADFIAACRARLNEGGMVILTVPAPFVDMILRVLSQFGLVKGMGIEQHHGMDHKTIPDLFARSGFSLALHRPCQFGLNHLYIFK